MMHLTPIDMVDTANTWPGGSRFKALSAVTSMIVLMMTMLMVAAPAASQDVRESNSAAVLFDEGIEAYRGARYQQARDLFKRVVADEPVHRSTTSAAIMSAKAAFQLEDYPAVATETARFIDRYPTSGYLEEARMLRQLAAETMNREESDMLSIGVLLSLDQQEVSQTQALFNGIAIAVGEYNASSIDRQIRMVFRDTQSRPSKAAIGVGELADEGVEFIIGALYSEEAIAAAEAADRNGVVYIAPLATDERVTDGRKFAFQANPSIRMRGRLMARFAVNGLRIQRLGVLASEDPERISERLTDAFIEEASQLGAEINFVSIMANTNQWARLSDSMPADTLQYIDAIYAPVTANPPEPIVGAMFSSLDRLRPDTLRVLGNASYHDLPMAAEAGRYTTTYSNDFYVNESDGRVVAFQQKYRSEYQDEPNRLVYAGYDVTSFMLHTLQFVGDDELVDVLFNAPVFNGIVSRIGFEGGNVNRTMFYHRYANGELSLLR
jgi:branched-chain amino acid transport system substrate-binding protein